MASRRLEFDGGDDGVSDETNMNRFSFMRVSISVSVSLSQG